MNIQCTDDYSNAFNLTCGTQFVGHILQRGTQSSLGNCLTMCDLTPSCVAVNYYGTTCQLLDRVTSTTTAPGYQAATRPTDASTVNSTPPPSTNPISNNATMTGSLGPVSATESVRTRRRTASSTDSSAGEATRSRRRTNAVSSTAMTSVVRCRE